MTREILIRSPALPTQRRGRLERRGMAVVVVIGLMAITLALSYSMLRTQVTCIQIQSNSLRRSKSQLAAMAGIQAALRIMSQPDWTGVGESLYGDVSDTDSYYVTVETGDPSLVPSHPDYAEYPYRVTLISTGTAHDPVDSGQRSIHRLRVVVQLVRRRLADPPSSWSAVMPYTVYQWSKRHVDFELPARIEGPCYLQGRLWLAQHYPNGDAREEYLGDLELMRAAGLPDYRPFDGPLSLPFSRNPDRSLLVNELKVSVKNVPARNSEPIAHPGDITSYRLYPGGQEYMSDTLPLILKNQTIGPDPLTNPLGVYIRHGSLYVRKKTTVEGFLLTWGGSTSTDLHVSGENIAFQAPMLPPLAEDSNRYQLPAIAARDDIYVYDKTDASIRGAVYAGDDYEVLHNHHDVQVHLRGKLVCAELEFQPHRKWDRLNWRDALEDFEEQNAIRYFPQWIERRKELAPDPLVTVKPDSVGVVHHWPDWNQPLFVPHPDDGGLRWEVVDWKDGI